ncbi:hypothetical protein HQ560_10935 [bacterium]|nr:hypothetical protein [bacterium]
MKTLHMALLCVAVLVPSAAVAGEDMARTFQSPPRAVGPWAYWWWLKGNVSESDITRDLEAMKAKGFSGFLAFDARGYHEGHVPPPASRMDFMSSEWRQKLRFAMVEAKRLGLTMSVNLSSCAGALKGPWNVGDDAPKRLVWALHKVKGPSRFDEALPQGDWGRSWDVAVVAVRHAATGKVVADVRDLSSKVDPQGRLAWDVPQGQWTLLRFAYALMKGREDEVDILSSQAVGRHFERMGGALLKDAGPLAGETLTHFYSVSWEGAIPTWTAGFEREFARRRGYGLLPYLPVLAGMTVGDAATSARFLRDYRKTLGDCFMDHCYGTLRILCHRAGLKWHSESGGPWNRKLPTFGHADQIASLGRNDMPQGEFWWGGRGMNRPAAMAAHIYGRPLAATEAFTHMRAHWSAYPASLKPDADAAFCDGINHFVWHTFSASPPEFGKPGIEYFAGTHLNPNVTWWRDAGPFIAYLTRCQFLLRQGQPVVDVCCYTGDRPYLHWGRGETWSPSPTLTLGKGHTYDLMTTEVLMTRLRAQDGGLALPEGMRYRLLVVDLEQPEVPPAALRRIIELVEAGATVVLGKRKPTRAPGLRDYPACDENVRRLADRLWGKDAGKASRRSLGKGWVIAGAKMEEAVRLADVRPDVSGPWRWTHRRTDDADIYFLSGQGSADIAFRVRGKEPELWDPCTGRIRDAALYRATEDGGAIVPIALPANGSIFVVFRRPASDRRPTSAAAPAGGSEADDGIRARRLSGPWKVRFAPGWGAPESIVMDKLVAWDTHPHEGIKYFSGTATYRTSFELGLEQSRQPLRLALGRVGCIARVRVNGRDLGVVWTAPWRVDLTGVARLGQNDLEIDVTNVWVNRLVGDARLPEERRRTKTNVPMLPKGSKLRPYRGYSPDSPLVTSGLLGPVILEFAEERDVRF